mmetsp:Transcript_6564/g.11533  ORF Transcript_6564/g.11533 Transcript_6564/m.11533 type:complete len:202 (+) Transcript_6564:841-1446(+)
MSLCGRSVLAPMAFARCSIISRTSPEVIDPLTDTTMGVPTLCRITVGVEAAEYRFTSLRLCVTSTDTDGASGASSPSADTSAGMGTLAAALAASAANFHKTIGPHDGCSTSPQHTSASFPLSFAEAVCAEPIRKRTIVIPRSAFTQHSGLSRISPVVLSKSPLTTNAPCSLRGVSKSKTRRTWLPCDDTTVKRQLRTLAPL